MAFSKIAGVSRAFGLMCREKVWTSRSNKNIVWWKKRYCSSMLLSLYSCCSVDL